MTDECIINSPPNITSIKTINDKIALLEKDILSLKRAKKMLMVVDEIIGGVGNYGKNPTLVKTRNRLSVTNRDRILLLFRDNSPMTIQQVYQKLTDAGLEIKKNTVNTVLYNMVKRGSLVQIKKGLYELP